MAVPLDSDSFLRRECPTCEREFKWFVSRDDEGERPAPGGYFCPYCAIQAPPDHYFTQAQIELAANAAAREMIGPAVEQANRDLRAGRHRGDLVTMDLRYDPPEAMDPLVETDDMTRYHFTCHPTEPVKVADDWDRDVHCLICGQPTGTHA